MTRYMVREARHLNLKCRHVRFTRALNHGAESILGRVYVFQELSTLEKHPQQQRTKQQSVNHEWRHAHSVDKRQKIMNAQECTTRCDDGTEHQGCPVDRLRAGDEVFGNAKARQDNNRDRKQKRVSLPQQQPEHDGCSGNDQR